LTTRVPWWRTEFGDEEAAAASQAVARGRLSQGPITAELEVRFAEALNVPYVTMTTDSGSVIQASQQFSNLVKGWTLSTDPVRTWPSSLSGQRGGGTYQDLVQSVDEWLVQQCQTRLTVLKNRMNRSASVRNSLKLGALLS